MKTALNTSDRLLIAAYELVQSGKSQFTAEDLVVAAWRRFPETFGLAGYPDQEGGPAFPDSNRVYVEIMGTKPLRSRGFLAKVGVKTYQLTRAGEREAVNLLSMGETSSVARTPLDRGLATKLRHLLDSKATQKVKEHREEDLTFHDACVFWGISPRSSSNELHAHLADLRVVVDAAKELAEQKEVSFQRMGEPITSAAIDMVLQVHAVLLAKFAQEVTIIEQRRERF